MKLLGVTGLCSCETDGVDGVSPASGYQECHGFALLAVGQGSWEHRCKGVVAR